LSLSEKNPKCARHNLKLTKINHPDSPDNNVAWQCPYSKMIWWDSELIKGIGYN
jgi:hypothetical protein